MKKLFLSALMAVVALGANAKIYYCDPASTKTNTQGMSWEQALSFRTLRQGINSVMKSGDTVFIKGGTIAISSSQMQLTITKPGITLIGGVNPAATGKTTDIPVYPSATPTVFDGQNTSTSLIRVDFSSNMDADLTLQGFDMINTNNPTEEPSEDTENYLYSNGALRIFCGNVTVKNCRIYNHKTTVNEGSQCVVNLGAKLHMIDCDVHDGISMGRGGLLRARDFYPNGKDQEETNIAPQTVIERCSFYNGNSSSGIAFNQNGSYAGGLHISSGPIYVINSTIANNRNYSSGAAISVSTAGCVLISSSVLYNEGDRASDPAADKKYNYGSVRVGSDGQLKMVNTFALDANDNGKKAHVVFYQDENTIDAKELVISGGHNVLGTLLYYKNGAEDNSFGWLASDIISYYGGDDIQTFSKYFSSINDMTYADGFTKYILPKQMQDGASKDELQACVDKWFPDWVKDKIDVTVDQRGFKRDEAKTCVGAAAVEATPGSALNHVNAVRKSNIKYNVLGQPVNNSYKGIVILNGKTYLQ